MSKGLKLRKEVMFRNSSLPDEFVTLGKLFDVSIPIIWVCKMCNVVVRLMWQE